ncbi:helix-turn-helix domain-containing protein [Cohnella fermenti]|uniref:Helix-turn-helix domain-containing protein n=1 Tax=Cohnella fermenti TaxID=2565925 RepID=A0A4V3WDW5_9BACL|nr:helix-turn-helix domain-containing protein [Cohnella fermenti]THF73871.1 helix-turn-helix domain-containing protein [Cohnella fermenti]
MFAQYDEVLTVDDVMEALNIGRSKVYELLRSKKLKSFKLKGYRIPKAALKEFVLSESNMNASND